MRLFAQPELIRQWIVRIRRHGDGSRMQTSDPGWRGVRSLIEARQQVLDDSCVYSAAVSCCAAASISATVLMEQDDRIGAEGGGKGQRLRHRQRGAAVGKFVTVVGATRLPGSRHGSCDVQSILMITFRIVDLPGKNCLAPKGIVSIRRSPVDNLGGGRDRWVG